MSVWNFFAEAQIGGTGFSPYISATLLDQEFEFANGFTTGDTGAPTFFGRIGVKYDFAWRGYTGIIDAHLRGESSATQRDETGQIIDASGNGLLRQSAGFAVLDVDSQFVLSDNATLTVGLNNLLNKTYDPIDQNEGQERGFDVFLTLTF